MRNLFGKFAAVASLFILTFTSCKKEVTQTGDQNAYTTFEVSNVTSANKLIQVDGIIGEKLATNGIIPKIQITRTDELGKKGIIYTYTNVNLSAANTGITFKPKGAYGKKTNNVYTYSAAFPAVLLGKGVKGSTTITIDVFDATQIIATFSTTNLDYGIKL